MWHPMCKVVGTPTHEVPVMRSTFAFIVASALALGTLTMGCSHASAEDDVAGAAADLSPADRSGIMDALRAKVKPELANQDIVFNVAEGDVLRVEGSYAWLQGKIQLRAGG